MLLFIPFLLYSSQLPYTLCTILCLVLTIPPNLSLLSFVNILLILCLGFYFKPHLPLEKHDRTPDCPFSFSRAFFLITAGQCMSFSVLSHCLFSRLCDCDWLFCFFSFHAYFIMQEALLKILLTPQLFMSLLSPIKLAEWSTTFRQQAVSPLVGCLHRTIGYTSQCFPLRTSCLFVLMGFHTLILQFSSSLLHLYKDNQSTPAAVHWPPYRSPLLNSHTIIAVLLLFIHCMSVVHLFLYLCQPEVLLWICCYSFIRKKWWGMWSSVATLALATVK